MDGKPLVIVRQKPLHLRRRAAKAFEAARLLQRYAPASAEVTAVGGRNVVVADGSTVAIMQNDSETMAWNFGALQEMFGSGVVASLKSELE